MGAPEIIKKKLGAGWSRTHDVILMSSSHQPLRFNHQHPKVEADHPELADATYRSLLSLILNKWISPHAAFFLKTSQKFECPFVRFKIPTQASPKFKMASPGLISDKNLSVAMNRLRTDARKFTPNKNVDPSVVRTAMA